MPESPPLIAHIIHRLGIGGLENGLVNLINAIPRDRFRHCIVCLKDSSDFALRIQSDDVPVYTLNKNEGRDWTLLFRVYRLFREIKPDIVHTRNLAAIECQLPACLAGVQGRVHSEHGWDVYDPFGNNLKYQFLRRLYAPLIQRFIPLSQELADYLRHKIHVPERKITRICNGVDTGLFNGNPDRRAPLPDTLFPEPGMVRIGTIGRMHGVKDQTTLVKAFLYLIRSRPEWKNTIRLVLVGDGPLRAEAMRLLDAENASGLAWLPGARNDIAEILRGLDLFVLPSIAEGISNTILEAMASGLAVVATGVGGNADLVVDGITGRIVPKQDSESMAKAIEFYIENPDLRRCHGRNGLDRIKKEFSLGRMVEKYLGVYSELEASSAAVKKYLARE
ncbi:MAG: TIGR03088 family PEP-CTERM/XrtA system glycosyltransferase [Methylococcaceae bacterium]|nr:TIGR03088 family PEP-CTERM/XrtA system glycosyltransferase [Methylococcaceae bacterium]MCI0733301.1 TIGR03088 family PEP-CTERM/XrtA system glycosyltransferase [Methylococcaceae bacterium]